MNMVMLAKTISNLQLGLAMAPALNDGAGVHAWEVSHVVRQRALRALIGIVIVRSGEGQYIGQIGEHGMDLCGIAVIGDDGYQALIEQWLAVAVDIATGKTEEIA